MHGPGVCWRINERFNAQNYHGIVEKVMLSSILQTYPENNFTYQHDNCPVHTARIIEQRFEQNQINVLH